MSGAVLWYATRGAGAVSLILLSTVVALGLLTSARFQAPGWPRLLTAGLHRNLSLTAVAFLVLHVVTAVTDPFTSLGWVAAVVPFASWYRPFWLGLGTIAAELAAALVASSLLRRRIGYRAWRAVHWLAYACWPVAVVHGLGTGTDAGAGWMLVIELLCGAAVAAALAHRLTRPAAPSQRSPRFGSGTSQPAGR
ncbi:MAG TPA: ferric reductase-like transmembrane domain-containing protein [Candidatus Dormibacteraeota bacterium]|jgi:predicted ferric reductase